MGIARSSSGARGALRLSVLLIGAAWLCGQSLDTAILGRISDSSGAVVPHAAVAISQPATGFVRNVLTGTDGNYEVRYLAPGEYTVEVKAPGFRSERRTSIGLQVGQQARIDFELQVGDVQQTVEVVGAAPVLQTENATLGEVVGTERIHNLPLNGRNFADLAALTPGVRVVTNAGFPGSFFVTNGTRNIWSQVNFDGVTAMNNRHAFVAMFPSVDALAEFKVQSGNYSAEYGGNAGANISVQLRSGTNQFHGSVFEFLRNDNLDARGYFRPEPLPKDVLQRNQFGGVLAGPVIRDKTFFMASYEGMRAMQQTPSNFIVPTPAQRLGDFSDVSASITDPLSGAPFPGNVIPQDRLNPVSVNLIENYMPPPNQAGSLNYAAIQRVDNNRDQALGRLDHHFSSRDQVFGHYIFQREEFPRFETNPFFKTDREFTNHSVGAQHVHTFSPTVLNELRFGYQRGFRTQLSPRRDTGFTADELGIRGLRGPDGRVLSGIEAGFPAINISGFLPMGDRAGGYTIDRSQTYQVVENVSVIRGKHGLKMGADLRWLLDEACTANWIYGQLDFTQDIAGNAMAAFMLGYPRTVLTPEGIPINDVRQWRHSLYFQDDWKVTPRLTLNLGVRYDLLSPLRDESGQARTLRFIDGDPSRVALHPDPPRPFDLTDMEYWHLAPRFGLAYRLLSRTVVRGGYGIFTAANHFDNINILQLSPPTAGTFTLVNERLSPVATIDNPVPSQLIPANPVFNVSSISPDGSYKNGYMQNWNVQVGHEFSNNDALEVGYVGSKGTYLDSSVHNFNSPDPGPGPIQPRRPYPDFARVRMQFADGNSSYHSLQARFEHRFSRGLSLTAAYNWSHMIDDQNQSSNWGGAQAQNPRDRGALERADSVYDLRHSLVLGYLWQMPFGRGLRRPLYAFLGGWSLGGIVTLQSGNPYLVNQSGDSQNTDAIGQQRPNLVPGQSAELSDSQRDPALWFNTAAFSRSVLEYGNTPRNPLVGPGTSTFDLSASKSFRIVESHEVMFRAEFFNAFNTPQFANPGSQLGTGSFGRVTSTKIDQRQIQLALKYTF